VSDIAEPARDLAWRAKVQVLAAVLLALFLGALDQTVVGTALPRIVTQLGGNELYTWVVTAYLLTSTISIPFWGKLSDLYGRRRLMMIGIAIFLTGSALAGLSQEMWQLIALRGVQGIGAGSLFPISLAVIGDLFAPAERGKYQGLFGAVFGMALLVGPGVGGFLTDQVSWHWVFYVNVPTGLVSLYAIWRLLPNVRSARPSHAFDVAGGAVFALAMVLLLVGLTNLQAGQWTDLAGGGLVAGGLALSAAFVLVEARAREPIVPLALWRTRSYAASLLATFLFSVGFYAALVFLPRWFQVVRGESATASGYMMFPFLIGVIAGSITAGQLIARTGRYKPVILLASAAMACGFLLLANLHATTALPLLWVWMLVSGLGAGPLIAAFTIVVQNSVPIAALGAATSNLTFFRQMGGAVGLALAGTTFSALLASDLQPSLVSAGVPSQLAEQASRLGTGGVTDLTGAGVDLARQLATILPVAAQPYLPSVVRGVHEAVTRAVDVTFVLGMLAALLTLIVSLVLQERPLRRALSSQLADEELSAAPAPGPAR
jgi:EmrB/QacA subfamily drug resistance transporter